MQFLQRKTKLKVFNIFLALLLLTLLTGLHSKALSWYTYRQSIPNMRVSTGTLDLGINPKHFKLFTEEKETLPQEVLFSNLGSLTLQYRPTKINKSHDCRYVRADITVNGGLPYSSESLTALELVPHSVLAATNSISYIFSLKADAPDRNINCEINLHIIGWQGDMVSPDFGFTDKEILKMGIIFKKKLLEPLVESEVKSFPTSDTIILPESLL